MGYKYNFITVMGQYEQEKDFKLGPGMAVVNVKGLNIVAPKGTRVQDKGSWVEIEDLGQFLGRRFDETEGRLQRLEQQQGLILEELAQIKKSMEELKQSKLTSEKN